MAVRRVERAVSGGTESVSIISRVRTSPAPDGASSVSESARHGVMQQLARKDQARVFDELPARPAGMGPIILRASYCRTRPRSSRRAAAVLPGCLYGNTASLRCVSGLLVSRQITWLTSARILPGGHVKHSLQHPAPGGQARDGVEEQRARLDLAVVTGRHGSASTMRISRQWGKDAAFAEEGPGSGLDGLDVRRPKVLSRMWSLPWRVTQAK
ncbi:hypothetical protein MAPG_11948 [Magnaporthiopsis poae ATCC 64411]|uniref:Uncharacterized protein n=1 Tax=Magnaporthiopsis poae (strain ATCC 64411 / 73-15) TaxID=644358 RepID=A0A0C4EGJ5_MAGP6|nr:hypothetical protein MAPG_11948 [Magnaporthiopsis poae ATCC 64411]